MRRAGHVEQVHYRICGGKSEGKKHLQELDVGKRIILKRITKKTWEM
jgi:hypothetical protein